MFGSNKRIFWIAAFTFGLVGAIFVLYRTKKQVQQEQILEVALHDSLFNTQQAGSIVKPVELDSSKLQAVVVDSFQIDEQLDWEHFIDALYLRLVTLLEQQKACLHGQGYCPGAAVLEQRQAAVNSYMAQITNNYKLDRFPSYRSIRLLEEQMAMEQPKPGNLKHLREINFLRKRYLEQLKKSIQKVKTSNTPS